LGTASHLSGAIQYFNCGWYKLLKNRIFVRMNGGYARSNWTSTRIERTFALDQRHVPNPNASNVGDGIQRTWLSNTHRDAKIAKSREIALLNFGSGHAAGSYAAVIMP
jgi:hypothetical protein